jgi:hypothetical protein
VEPPRTNVLNDTNRSNVQNLLRMDSNNNTNKGNMMSGSTNPNIPYNHQIANNSNSNIYNPIYTNPGNQTFFQQPNDNSKPEDAGKSSLTGTKKFAERFRKKRSESIDTVQFDHSVKFIDNNITSPEKRVIDSTSVDNKSNYSNKNVDLSKDELEYLKKMELKTEKDKELHKSDHGGGKKKLLFSKYSPIVFKDQYTEEDKKKLGLSSDYNHHLIKTELQVSSAAKLEGKNITQFMKSNYLDLFLLY